MKHPGLIDWEEKLTRLLSELDDVLEDDFGHHYRLHPARAQRGSTANNAHDGLFDVTANFTLGLGSDKGKGYVIDIRLSTLEKVDSHVLDKIHTRTIAHLNERLPHYFPGRELKVQHDSQLIKLHGDLSLGQV